MEKKKLIGFYDYTVILTYIGMWFAFCGILCAINENFLNSIICLMAAGVCDMFDGAVASTKDRNPYEKHFGIQIDSLCDLISFGVLPAVFIYVLSGRRVVVAVCAALYVLCALIRLAYFNVQEFERQQASEGSRKTYLGIPVTTVAIVLPFCYVIHEQLAMRTETIFYVFYVLLTVGFVAGIEIRKPKLIGKIILILVGLIEIIGIALLSGVCNR